MLRPVPYECPLNHCHSDTLDHPPISQLAVVVVVALYRQAFPSEAPKRENADNPTVTPSISHRQKEHPKHQPTTFYRVYVSHHGCFSGVFWCTSESGWCTPAHNCRSSAYWYCGSRIILYFCFLTPGRFLACAMTTGQISGESTNVIKSSS